MARQNRAPLDMGSSKITSVTDPTSAQDASTKNYADTTVLGQTGAKNARGSSSQNTVQGLNIEGLTTMPDANLTGVATDRVIACTTTLTAGRTYTLPAASSVNAGTMLRFIDLGGLNGSNLLTISAHSGDTVRQTIGFGVMPVNGAWTYVSDGTSQWTIVSYFGTVGVAYGGTGAILAATAFDNLAPTTTRGDLIYRGASGNLRLAKGTSGNFLKQGANDPAWAQPATTDLSDWPLTTRGDLPYAGASNVPTRLAKGTSGQYLQIGANDPAWASIQASDIAHSYSNAGEIHTITTATNPTALTTILTGTLSQAANSLVAGDRLEIVAFGFYTNSQNAATLELALLLGATTVFDFTSASTLATSANPRRWLFRASLHVHQGGASGSFLGEATVIISPAAASSSSFVDVTSVGAASPNAGGVLAVANYTGQTAAAVDLTSAQAFDLQAKISVSSSTATVKCQAILISKLAA